MTLLGFIGIILGLVAGRFAFVAVDRLRISMFALAYILHVTASLAFYVFVQTESADSALYYYDPMNYYERNGFGLSTDLIVWFVQSIKQNFGGTYLDFFLLFQAFGFWGIALLMRIFEELYVEVGEPQPLFTFALLLIPSLHWWSGGVGKDAPFFFALTLTLWASLHMRRRLVWLGLSILFLLAIRAHIALLVLAALFLMVVSERKIALWQRTALSIAAGLGIWAAISTIQTTLNIDVTDADSLAFALEVRENVLNSADAGTSRVDAAYVYRLFSLLFRPIFYDAEDMFGYVTSVENLLVALLFGYGLLRLPTILYLARTVAFFRYAFLAMIFIIGFQALAYYNVGLGLRQKWTMIVPFLFVLFISLIAFSRAKARATAEKQPTATHLRPKRALAGRAVGEGPG